MEGLTLSNEMEKNSMPMEFRQLVEWLVPRAIDSDEEYHKTLGIIDRLMQVQELNEDQAAYLETLVQLVEAYDAKHFPIDTSDIKGIDVLRHLMGEQGMTASDLGRLLGLHPSMGSKILNGDRSLTVNHLKKLAERFKVKPDLFID